MPLYPMNPNDIVEITVKGLLANQVVMWTHHLKCMSNVIVFDGPQEVTDILSFVNGALGYAGVLCGVQTSDVTYDTIRGQVVYNTRRPYMQVAPIPACRQGVLAPPTMPPNVSVFVNKQSSIVGRGRHGGWHLCGAPTANITNGVIAPAYRTSVGAAAALWQTDITTTSGTVYHPVIFNPRKPTPVGEIVTTTVEATSRIERRRTVGLGI